jgi:lambda family phage tail tape measure protein
MTQDIASLGIKVETGDVAKASTELEGLAQAGAKAEKSTADLRGQSKQAGASIKAMAAETKAAEAATAKLGKQTEAVGVSAKQTAAALRGVPAQFTDIVTSLQGGQAPLTVLLQQGGQLKDMFGGAGPAAKALGGYVAGLINPFTLAAAAAAALGVAYFKGSEEASAFSASLALTGNTAGASVNQLSDLAQQIAQTTGTVGNASAVLARLAASTRIPIQAFEEIAAAALKFESATGQAAEETVSNFEKIAKDPTAEILRLNESMNFLTASTYEQIKALQDQGRVQEAAALANTAYEEGMNRTSASVKANLGTLETSWNAVKNAAKGAWDAALNVGRTETLDQQIAALDKQLNAIANARKLNKSDGFSNLAPDDSFREEALQREKTEKLVMKAEEDRRTASRGFQQQQQQQSVADQLMIDKLRKETESNADKRARELGEYRLLVERRIVQARTANDKNLLISPQQQTKDIAAINEKYKDPAGKANQLNLTGYNDAQNAIKDLQATYSNSDKELEAQQKAGLITQQSYLDQRTALIRAEREEVTGAYQAEIAALEAVKDRTGTTGEQRIQLDQKIADARTSMVKAQKDADSQLEVLATNEEGRVKKQALVIKTYTDALNQQNITLRQQGQRDAAGIGQGDRQKALSGQFNGIDDKANAQRIDLANQYGDGTRGMNLDEYNAKLKAVAQSQQDLRNTVIANYDDMTSAQGSWTAGASSAWENYLESTRDVAGQTKGLFTSAFSSMEDAIVNFAMTGKLSFADFAKSVLSDMARIATRQASSSALSGLFGLATTAASAYFGSGSSAGSTQAGYTGSDYSSWVNAQAKGGAWSGGVQMFADGGAFTNSIVSKPTAFGMANGNTGVMGEAGPEAIVPLARDSQGRLGVRGGANSSTVSVSVTVDASEGGGASPDPARLAEAIKVVCRQEIATARRNGGQLA